MPKIVYLIWMPNLKFNFFLETWTELPAIKEHYSSFYQRLDFDIVCSWWQVALGTSAIPGLWNWLTDRNIQVRFRTPFFGRIDDKNVPKSNKKSNLEFAAKIIIHFMAQFWLIIDIKYRHIFFKFCTYYATKRKLDLCWRRNYKQLLRFSYL